MIPLERSFEGFLDLEWLETVASVATVLPVWKDGFGAAGMSNSATFLRPVTSGTIEAIARRRSREPDRWVWNLDFVDEQGRLCAIVEVAIAVRPR